MITENIKLYSWVDIQDKLLAVSQNDEWLEGIKVETSRSGIYIFHEEKTTVEDIKKWLEEVFPAAVNPEGIRLENLGNGNRYLPIFYEKVDKEDLQGPSFLPSFSRPKAIGSRINLDSEQIKKRSINNNPVMIAAHSFKGGVGRTLHALALAAALEKENDDSTILFIDADFEAPGTTWLTPNPEISFVDVLNLAHSIEQPFSFLPAIAKSLENQSQGNIYYLPAFRTERQLRSLEIKPEHIFRFAENPFIITDIVVELAKEIKADYVIVDLRAGISELSANWLLDPRVSNMFVTTLNSQSVEGTLVVLDILAEQKNKYELQGVEPPAMIISQASPELTSSLSRIWNRDEEPASNVASQNIATLKKGFSKYLERLDMEEEDSTTVISPHYDSLLVLPNNWQSLKSLIQTSGLMKNIAPLAKSYLMVESEKNDILSDELIISSRMRMLEVLPDLVYAEKHLPKAFYKSNAIRNLANRNRTRIPNLVVIGAKGAGKTFLFRQILRSERWENFLEQAIGRKESAGLQSAEIVQVTIPEQIEDKTDVWVKHIKPYLIRATEQAPNLSKWRSIWIDMMAWSYGYKIGLVDIGDDFFTHLREKNTQVVFLFDGLEDLFTGYYQKEEQKLALRALLQDVQSYISVIPDSPLGVVTFIRKDMSEHAIQQNFGQFLDRYKEFELKWDRTEALRLVAWIMSHYEIIKLEGLNDEAIPSCSEDVLTEALYPLWGRKLGNDQSREARSANKILGILSNFNEEVQSRDLVRLLAEAIQKEMETDASYSDRIISPTAIKNAFPEVAEAKVKEVREENKNNQYDTVLGKLKKLATTLKIPFESEKGLTQEDINLLIDQGVLRRHNNKYYMAELFRLGLGIDKRKGKVKTEF